MQKITEFLEKNVQWVTLGIGGLFLLYMLYLYLPPVSAKLVTAPKVEQQVTLSSVDSTINESIGMRLKQAVQSTKVPDMKVKSVVKAWDSAMATSSPELAKQMPNSPYYYLPHTWDSMPTNVDLASTVNPLSALINTLPKLPAAVFDAVTWGRSQVALPAAAAGANAGAAPAAAAAQPAPGRNVVPAGFSPVDRQWVSVRFHISMKELYDAFNAANFMKLDQPANTYFASVEVVRQMLQPDGTWGPETPVSNLSISPTAPPFPDDSDLQAGNDYRAWASQHQSDMVRPQFYQVLKGDQWVPPGDALPTSTTPSAQPVSPVQPSSPAPRQPTPRESTPRSTTPRSNQSPGATPGYGQPSPSTPRSGRTGGRTARAPLDQARPTSDFPTDYQIDTLAGLELAQSSPGAPGAYGSSGVPFGPPPGYGDSTPGAPGISPGSIPSVPPSYGAPNGRSPAAASKTPAVGAFVPAAGGKDIDVWAHDDTVVSGKTYRYAIRYRLFNPIYGAINLANPPELQQKLAIASPLSDWSTPVKVPGLVQYAVYGSIRPGATSISFEVFRWADGVEQSHIFRDVSPGDMIGGDVDGVDFSTGVTLVDLPPDPRPSVDLYVLVVDSDGVMSRRDYRTDQSDPELNKLRDAVKAEAAATASPGGAAGRTGAIPPPPGGATGGRTGVVPPYGGSGAYGVGSDGSTPGAVGR